MRLVTDLTAIARLTEQHEEEDFAFRAFLKHKLDWPDAELDALLHGIVRQVMAQIDCAACRNCCREMQAGVAPEEAARLAAHLGLTAAEFEEQYLESGLGEKPVLRDRPCPFLDGSVCTVEADKPEDCRDFPHLLKPEFRTRTLGVLSSLEVCPISFNSWQRLKELLHFRR